MTEKIEELEKLRRKTAVWCLFLVLSIILLPVPLISLTVVVVLPNVNVHPAALFVPVIITEFVFVAILAFKAAPLRLKFIASYKRALIPSVLEEFFTDVTFSPGQYISEDTVTETGLIADNFNSYTGDDLLIARYKGVKFTASDLTIKRVTETKDGTSTTVYFMGKWFIFDFKKSINGRVKIVEREDFGKRAVTARQKADDKIFTENEAFNKRFSVSADNESDAFYLLTPHYIEAIMALNAKVYGQLNMCFSGGKLHVAFHNYKNALEPKIFKKITEENVGLIRRDIAVTANFVDGLLLS